MPLGPDPQRAAEVLARLEQVREVVIEAEDDVLASLVVTGEPHAQRVLDDWLDQVADTLRALGEAAHGLAPGLARFAAAGSAAGSETGDGSEPGRPAPVDARREGHE